MLYLSHRGKKAQGAKVLVSCVTAVCTSTFNPFVSCLQLKLRAVSYECNTSLPTVFVVQTVNFAVCWFATRFSYILDNLLPCICGCCETWFSSLNQFAQITFMDQIIKRKMDQDQKLTIFSFISFIPVFVKQSVELCFYVSLTVILINSRYIF
jgi:hypothetical protein